MKILILGGTGAMGISLMQIFKGNSHHDVFITSRSAHDDDNIHYVLGDAKNIGFLKEILSNHRDAIVDFMWYPVEEFQARYDLCLNATDQYFFLSSARVYAPIR